MANVAVTNTFTNGTTADASQVNTNFSDLVNFVNNRNTAVTSWDGFSVATASAVPAVIDNLTGANDVVRFKDNGSIVLSVSDNGNVVMGNAALSTSATDGFLNLNACAGTPTGVPTAYTGRIPIIVDSTNNLLYAYNSGWIGLTPSANGWTAAGETWTYASATTFTVATDVTSKYQVGDKIKLTQTTPKYFYISAISFSGSTTITITGGSDYSLANAAITSNFFSKQANPQGFPAGFNYLPTSISGWAATPTSTCFFSIHGRTVYLSIGVTGTSNSTSTIITPPITSSSDAGGRGLSSLQGVDNGSGIAGGAGAEIDGAGTQINFYSTMVRNATWTNSGTKSIFGNLFYTI